VLLKPRTDKVALRGLPVCLCNRSTLVAFSANYHDRLVLVVVHVGKGCVTLHEHAGVDCYAQLAAQVGHALRFMLAAAICEQNEGDALRL
jgi:hypothetical protein